MRAHHGADHVVGGSHGRRPIAERLVDSLLQGLHPRGDRHDLRAEKLHPHDVGRLPMRVLLPHVDDARQTEQCTRGRGRHTVLTGAGLGDDPLLAHPPRQQDLADRVVDLMGAGVVQVLALQVDLRAAGDGRTDRIYSGRDRRLLRLGRCDLGDVIGTRRGFSEHDEDRSARLELQRNRRASVCFRIDRRRLHDAALGHGRALARAGSPAGDPRARAREPT